MNQHEDVTAKNRHLEGIKVLDMTQYEAGAACTEVLAWYGADVVKIENPNGGDPARRSFGGSRERDSWYFLLLNANKRSVTIDVKQDDGLALLKKLVEKADVFVENFAPGVIERLGLGYETLRRINPGLIFAEIKGFGAGSANERVPAFDMIAQAAGGLTSITGFPDGPPVRPGMTLGDTGTGMLLTVGVIASLYRRKMTGEGERVQVAMQDSMMHYNRVGFSANALMGKAAQRAGNKLVSGFNPPCGLYQCKPFGPNDYVCVYTSHNNPEHWSRLLAVIGRDDLIGDARFDTQPERIKREKEIDEMMSAWSVKHDKYEAERLLGSAGIPAGAVRDTQELLDDESFEQRGIMQRMNHPMNGSFKMPGWPVVHNGRVAHIQTAPSLGEHNDSVPKDWGII